MKTFIIAFILALGFTATSNAQLSKITNSNPYKGTGSTWFNKINLAIDSINAHTNQMLDKLSASDTLRTNSVLQKSFSRSGGAGGGLSNPIDSVYLKGTTVKDTTGGYMADSVYIQVVRHDLPMQATPRATAYLTYPRIGSVTLKFFVQLSQDGGTCWIRDGVIRADSVNGCSIEAITFDLVGKSEGDSYSGAGRGAVYVSGAVVTTANAGGYSPTLLVSGINSAYERYRWRMTIRSGGNCGNGAYAFVTMTIYYRLNNSTWSTRQARPVWIEEF